PGCTRDVGRPADEVGSEEKSGEYVALNFSRMSSGRYALWIRPDSAAAAQLSIQLFSNPQAVSTTCGSVGGEVPLEGHEWYHVDLVLGEKTAADTCGFRLGTPTKAQAPSTLQTLVEPLVAPTR
ncbi:MAG: hypothetical protein ACRDL7_12580, partial [Gaiellaceae bacterium]